MARGMVLLRLLVLLLSCYGYIRWIACHVRVEFAPGVLFSSLCAAMFFAGILNVMLEAAWAVCILGVCLGIRSLIQRESWKNLLCPGILFLAAAAVILLVWLHGMILTDYDDFSHWGTVVKVMLAENRLPRFSDAIITYQSYPTGSAGLLYYFLTISGIHSEWFQLYVQSLFGAAMLAGLFAFGKGWLFGLFTGVCSAVFFLCCTGPINLLVDTLLPLVALGGLFFCVSYRDCLRNKYVWLTPYLVSLVAIKNSGILFAVFLMLLFLHYGGKEGLKGWLWLACITGLALLLWQKHVLLVYYNGMNSRHAMSAQSITGNLLRKGGEELSAVLRVFLEEILDVQNPAVLLLALVGLLSLFGWATGNRWTKESRFLLLFAGMGYVVYEIFVLGMYLTTMPYGEAIVLAGYARYHRTILIFCGGCIFLAVVDSLPEKGGGQLRALLLTSVLLYSALFPGLWYNNPKHCGFIREEFQQLITQYRVAPGKSYCVVVEGEYAEKYSGYLQYLIRYLLNSADLKVYSIDAYREQSAGWEDYRYLICFGESAEMDTFLQDTVGTTEKRVAEREK